MKTTYAGILFTSCLLAGTGTAFSQDLDCPAVEVIVGYGAGGGTDMFARSIQPQLEEELGLPVQVLNITGGSGAVAFSEVQSRPADGCTVFAISTDYVLLEVTNAADLSLLDLAPLVRAHIDVGLLNAVASGAESLETMVSSANDDSRPLLIGGVGAGSFDEGVITILMRNVDADYRYIPYDGSREMHADLLGGRLDLAYDEVATMLPMAEAGQVNPLMVAFSERLPTLPGVPTAEELGLSLSPPIWRGVAVHQATPAETKDIIQAAVEAALEAPSYLEFAKNRSLDLAPGYAGPEEFRDIISAELELFSSALAE